METIRKKILAVFLTLLMALSLMPAIAPEAKAETLTPNFYISGVLGNYSVGTYEGGEDIGIL